MAIQVAEQITHVLKGEPVHMAVNAPVLPPENGRGRTFYTADGYHGQLTCRYLMAEWKDRGGDFTTGNCRLPGYLADYFLVDRFFTLYAKKQCKLCQRSLLAGSAIKVNEIAAKVRLHSTTSFPLVFTAKIVTPLPEPFLRVMISAQHRSITALK